MQKLNQYHNHLLYYAAGLSLSLSDVDTKKRAEAEKFFNIFDNKVGKRVTAKTEITRKRTPRLQSMRVSTRLFGMP